MFIMDPDSLGALSTSVIAFVAIISLMFGFYYNIKTANTRMSHIITLELLFIIALGLFVMRMKWRIDTK